MIELSAQVRAIAAIGPGFDDWPSLLAQLHGTVPALLEDTRIPALTTLPPAERRRVGKVVKLAIATGLQACEAAGADPARLASVFTSSGGDGDNCHAICETLASDDRLISPTRFHNSVNNAASGYWGIATGAQAPSTIVSAFDGSFAAGLLEAVVQLHADAIDDILLIAYDVPYPAPLSEARPMIDAMSIALLLSRTPGIGSARLVLSLVDAPSSPLVDATLEHLRTGIPCARALPLMAAIAHVIDGSHRQLCILEHLAGAQLQVEVTPA